jgi:DNA-binding MarR family transcriptional regulator
MDRRLFYLLSRAQHVLHREADQQCEQHLSLSVTQLGALFFLAKAKGSTQKELAQALGLNKSTATHLVSRLESMELIRRENCTEDGRAIRLWTTELGNEKVEQARPLMKILNTQLYADFSPSEMDVVFRFLNSVIKQFSKKRGSS